MTDIIDQDVATTTAEIMPMLSLSRGSIFGLTIYTDRKPLARGGLGKGKKAGTIVADTLPELLRRTADLIELEGSLLDLANFIGTK